MKALKFCMNRNKTLGKYDLKYNIFSEAGIKELTEYLPEVKHVHDIEIPEKVETSEGKAIFEEFRKQLAENKPRKGKKKAGKKKKKK